MEPGGRSPASGLQSGVDQIAREHCGFFRIAELDDVPPAGYGKSRRQFADGGDRRLNVTGASKGACRHDVEEVARQDHRCAPQAIRRQFVGGLEITEEDVRTGHQGLADRGDQPIQALSLGPGFQRLFLVAGA